MKTARSSRFGRYEVLRELGRGAMGVVYKARDPKINRVVAIKAISLSTQPEADEREYRERFFREAEAAGRLSHPGIVTIFDVGEELKTRAPYIVMEYVSGQSLEKMLSSEGSKLPLTTALQLTQELAEALDCAHGQGVVHRDLKPANILVTEQGHAKIADFGVAKLNMTSLTLAGQVLGTPAYMSPEQLNDGVVDGRSDLFSLGTIFYTMVTGHIPFHGNSVITVCFKVVSHDPLRATSFDTDLPPGLDYIITRAMAKDPAQRYQRGMEMALDLKELRNGREPWSKTMRPFPGTTESPQEFPNSSKESSPTSDQKPAASLNPSAAPTVVGRYQGTAPAATEKSYSKTLLAGVGLLILVAGGTLAFKLRIRPHASIPVVPAASAIAAQRAVPSLQEIILPPPQKVVSPSTNPATLAIEVKHPFKDARLSIWVDDRLAHIYPLQGRTSKQLLVFRKVEGSESHALRIAPGTHSIRVRVQSPSVDYDQSAANSGKFVSGGRNILRVNFGKHEELHVDLR
jgi:serine/threonine protein kinase